MTRAWDEAAAAVFDVVPPGPLLLILLLVAAVIGALWYWFPIWVPRRLPRLPRRVRKRPSLREVPEPRERKPSHEPAAVPDPTLADRLAAEGRYAEAIRQRLRDTLGELVAARMIPPQPGWTAAELAAMAAAQRPSVARPLGGATELFAEIWYGSQPATQAHDQHMRALTDQVRAAL
jgi:hypothetical protein